MHKTMTMERAKVKKRTLKRGRHSFCLSFPVRAREQPQWSDRSAELMISRPPMCENRYHPKGNNPWEWARNKAIGHQKNITPPASHQVKACKKDSLLKFITSLKVRNAKTAVDASHQALS
jgi:hypothetical protein